MPPWGWIGIDVDWPNQDRRMGAKVTYTCPYRMATHTYQLSGLSKNYRAVFITSPKSQLKRQNMADE